MSGHIYHYFVSYFCRNEDGIIVPGFIEASTNAPISALDDIVKIKNKIEENNSGSHDVIVINYQLLRTE